MKELDFKEFPSSSYDDWKKIVLKELGTQSYDSIIWKNENGFETEPYFTHGSSSLDIKTPAHWDICQKIEGDEATDVNVNSIACLMGGAEAIIIAKKIDSSETLRLVLRDIRIDFIATHFCHKDNPVALVKWFIEYAREQKLDLKNLRGSMSYRGVGEGRGMLPLELITEASAHFSLFKIFTISSEEIHMRGGLPIHELAVSLAEGNELMHQLTQHGLKIDQASALVQFNFMTGASYFIEIAKLRVFRALWRTIITEYKPEFACSTVAFIHASTSAFLQTQKDSNNNLLRATTQSMSAVIGGADSVLVLPSVHSEKQPKGQALRIARNIQHLLKEESYFEQMRAAADGAFYIERLESNLIEQSWKMFQEIEAGGGITQMSTKLDALVAAGLEKRKSELREGKRVMVGINKYQNKMEEAVEGDERTLTGFMEKE